MPLVTLPNGIEVETPHESETLVLYTEIFETDSYIKNGLELRDGNCVFDIGANVGLFSVALAQRYRGLRLVLFEPVPETFAVLERNAERLLGSATATLIRAGVSSAAGHETFEVDPRGSTTAGSVRSLREFERRVRAARREAGRLAWGLAVVDDAERQGLISGTTARRLKAALSNRLLRPLVVTVRWAIFAVGAVRRRRWRRRIVCEMTTVSAAIAENDIEHIDLLKIDAEGAEWAVLQGIDDGDWPRIHQLTMEVHGTEPTERIRALLAGKGYEVAVDRNDWRLHELMGVRMLYARR